MNFSNTTIEQISRLVRDALPSSQRDIALGTSDPLDAHGMDSMRLMMLIMALQREFDIDVGEDDLVEENFTTIAALAGFVASKKEE